jgi:UDP-N-acetylmuramyl pentapeptide phosphotransferase/UDP-N-acetylglucosamine-1-phosphate transferase
MPPAFSFVAGLVGGCIWLPLVLWVLRRPSLLQTNFEGRPIPTAGGLLFLVVSPLCLGIPFDGEGNRLAASEGAWVVYAVAGFALLGAVDDRWGTPEFRGLGGHLRALRSGRLTTGAIKAIGGGTLAIALSLGLRAGGTERCVAALLIALAANTLNLLDRRPLRALKGFWLPAGALCLAGAAPLGVLLGASIPYCLAERRRRVMLGDTGANALGGAVGTAAAVLLPIVAQVAVVGVLLAFHLWAERNSLTAWIEARPWARALDQAGWDRCEGRRTEAEGGRPMAGPPI